MKVDKRLFTISPFWARRLQRIRGVSGLKQEYYPNQLSVSKMKMDNYNSCVVGEAYGFSQTYQNNGCRACKRIASNFVVYKNERTHLAIPRFEQLIVSFCNHIEKYHGLHLSERVTE